MRLFLAVDVPEKLREKLSPVLYALEKPGLKTAKREQLHVTVKFLGEVEDVKSIEERLKALKYSPFSARSTYISCFDYRVLWLGLESPEMAGLAQELDKLLPDLENSYDHFRPHITLARAKESSEKVKGLFHRWLQRPFSKEWTIDHIVLYASKRTPEGSEWLRLKEYNLSL